MRLCSSVHCEISWGGAGKMDNQMDSFHKTSAGPEQPIVLKCYSSGHTIVLSVAPFHAACKPGCRVCVYFLSKTILLYIDVYTRSNSFSVRTHLSRNNAICRDHVCLRRVSL